VWQFLLQVNRFYTFSEVKKGLDLHNQQVTNSLSRLEEKGLILRDVQFYGHKPRNVYLGLDPEDSRLKVKVVDNHGTLWTTITWEENDGSSISIVGIDLGELTNYIKQERDELILKWPEWINVLAEQGKVTFSDYSDSGLS